MKMDPYWARESGKIESTHRDVNLNWDKPALHFEYDVGGKSIEFRTTGDRVIITNETAGTLVALLIKQFPNLVLDALGNV